MNKNKKKWLVISIVIVIVLALGLSLKKQNTRSDFSEIFDNQKKLHGSYGWIMKHIPKLSKKSVILEIGSMDASDAIHLNKFYGNKVYAFEALPKNIKKCKINLDIAKHSGNDCNVEIVEGAVNNKNGEVLFYEAINAPGSGSIYGSTKNVLPGHNVMKNKNKVKVKSFTLQNWIKEKNLAGKVELIIMDLQGAELNALEGLIPIDQSIKHIALEAGFVPLYDGASTIHDTAKLLFKNGFKCIKSSNDEKFKCTDINKYYPDHVLWTDYLFSR